MPFLKVWMLVMSVGVVLWGLQALFAYGAGMLTPGQMVARGTPQGIPFTGHGSTWFVIGVLVPLIATLVAMYGGQWRPGQWAWAAAVGIVVSAVMHIMYTLADYPDYIAAGRLRLSAAGWMHFILFAGAITVLVLFYLCTAHAMVARPLVPFVTWYMVAHVFVGNHMVTKLHPPRWFPPYAFWDAGAWGAIFAVVAVLILGSWIALR